MAQCGRKGFPTWTLLARPCWYTDYNTEREMEAWEWGKPEGEIEGDGGRQRERINMNER